MAACPACGAELPDGARFCPACGSAQQGETAREVRKVVTALFCDIAGSTALAERLDPESFRGMMSRYFEEMKAVVDAHGGNVEKFIGDAVVAIFGVPLVREDDALRAISAALEMRNRLEELNDELDRRWGVRLATRTGIQTGEVVVSEGKVSGSVFLGDAMHTAARLQQAAGTGEILIGRDTHRLVRDAVEAESISNLVLKGKAESVGAWRLLGVLPRAPRRRGPRFGRARTRACSHRASLRTSFA